MPSQAIHSVLAAGFGCAVLLGCGKGPKLDATVEGTVTVDGQLAERGTVTFYPTSKGPAAAGRIFEDGSYRVGTGRGDVGNPDGGKLPAGEYVVTILVSGESPEGEVVAEGGPPVAGPRLSAAKYAAQDTTDLKYTVKKGRNVIDLALVGTSTDPPPPEESEEDDASQDDDAPAANGEDGANDSDKAAEDSASEASDESETPAEEAPADRASGASDEPVTESEASDTPAEDDSAEADAAGDEQP